MLNKDDKIEPLPMEDLIRPREKRGRSSRSKPLWQNLIQPVGVSPQPEQKLHELPVQETPSLADRQQKYALPIAKRYTAETPSNAEQYLSSGPSMGSETGSLTGSATGSIITNRFKTGSEIGSLIGAATGSPPTKFAHREIKSLTTGVAGKLVQFLSQKTREHQDEMQQRVSLPELAIQLGVKFESLKTVVRRLLKYKLLEKEHSERGYGGYISLKLSETAIAELQRWNQRQFDSKNAPNNLVQQQVHYQVQLPSSSCSIFNNNTTTTPNQREPYSEPISIPKEFEEILNTINFRDYGLRSPSQLAPFLGEGKTCETPTDLEEFFHKFDAVLTDKREKGEHVASKAGLLISCFRRGWVTVPQGYKSLEETRLQQRREEAEERLKKISEEKRRLYRANFALFKEDLPAEQKAKILAKASEESKTQNKIGASPVTIERIAQAEYDKELKRMFASTLSNADEVIAYLS